MSLNDFFNSLLKNKWLIVFLMAGAVVMCSLGISATRSYTSKTIIKYIGRDAPQGLAENGEQIDPYEISSSTVIKKAAIQLGFPNANIEEIRRNIRIKPIVPTSETEKYASWIDSFSDYSKNEEKKEKAQYYLISYTSSAGEAYTRNMLSAIVNQYRIFYVSKYTYNSNISKLDDEIGEQYDYYETVELLKNKINANIKYLQNIIDSDLDYRSSRSGNSMSDLIRSYKAIKERELSTAEKSVLESGASKDSWRLIGSLQKKMSDKEIESTLNLAKADTEQGLMSVYAEKNQQYLWKNSNEGEGEGEQVRGDVEYQDRYTDEKTTYDQMVLNYVDYRTESMNAIFDRNEYERVMNSFIDKPSPDGSVSGLETEIKEICDEYNKLHSTTIINIEDYNKFKSSRSIKNISGVIVQGTGNTIFNYTVSLLIAVILGVVISVILELLKKIKTEVHFENEN